VTDFNVFPALLLDVLLALSILVVFVADLLLPPGEKRGLGPLAAFLVLGVLAASFVTWSSGEAFGGAFATDPLALYLKRILYVAAFIGILGAVDHVEERMAGRQGEYFVLILCSLLGASLLSGARDMVLLVVAFELMGIPLYMLGAFEKSGGLPGEASIKLYLVGASSSTIALYGLSVLYGATGSTSIAELAHLAGTGAAPLIRIGVLAVIAGMSFKIGAVPFHMWVPDTYEGAPTPFVTWLSTGPKVAGFAALIRIVYGGLLPFGGLWGGVLLVMAGATMVGGNLVAIPQTNAKRLLAGSGIAHVGYVLLALALGNKEGLGVLLYYLAAYVFTNTGVFVVHTVVGRGTSSSTEGDDVSVYRGLASRSPALALAMLLFLLSLGGIPFVAGFWAKFQVFLAAWHAGQIFLVLLGAGLAVLALFYYLRIARQMYVEPAPTDGEDAKSPVIGLPSRIAIAAALAGVLGLGIYPRPFVEAAMEAARAVMGG
jgi:NADH-quinone oxidoreductase subunit N